jgi:hypothetical protein
LDWSKKLYGWKGLGNRTSIRLERKDENNAYHPGLIVEHISKAAYTGLKEDETSTKTYRFKKLPNNQNGEVSDLSPNF